MSTEAAIKKILDSVLNLGGRAEGFDRSTPLLGSVPELDSMAVVNLLTSLEEQFGIIVDDDEVSAETFETLGSLADFVEAKSN
ncbi:acyl carrier protein [Ectothiorhodospira sp. BSL-9]|uniref:acyl carrier protein n=1 Tax=Ectothiorhodospira sp. BSL-9 TaxID=1442136 RepID=UPI0007B44018|nr:phosphopantetheine-binding protein [Ectothiorhodospira sp. BSL-9]ANB03761.1 acyl carrier protein [Ectothiorhodospira sp. BSL-9]